MDLEKTRVRFHNRGDPTWIPRLDVAAEDQVESRPPTVGPAPTIRTSIALPRGALLPIVIVAE